MHEVVKDEEYKTHPITIKFGSVPVRWRQPNDVTHDGSIVKAQPIIPEEDRVNLKAKQALNDFDKVNVCCYGRGVQT